MRDVVAVLIMTEMEFVLRTTVTITMPTFILAIRTQKVVGVEMELTMIATA
jgi:hypothetical protein